MVTDISATGTHEGWLEAYAILRAAARRARNESTLTTDKPGSERGEGAEAVLKGTGATSQSSAWGHR